LRSGPSGASSSITGRTTLARFSVEHDVRNAGTTMPAAPAAAAVPRKFLLDMDGFFIIK
jgi:hypothetical protein